MDSSQMDSGQPCGQAGTEAGLLAAARHVILEDFVEAASKQRPEEAVRARTTAAEAERTAGRPGPGGESRAVDMGTWEAAG